MYDFNLPQSKIITVTFQDFYHDNNNYQEFTDNYLVGLVIKLSKDKVSNVRMLSGQVLRNMIRVCKKRENTIECAAALEELKNDVDPDVVISSYE